MIVLDASAALDLLLRGPEVETLEARILGQDSLHAPHLLDLEVVQALRRWTLAGLLHPDRAEQALTDLAALPVHRYPHDILVPGIWQLRDNATAYDAAYLALAETLDATLLTRDEKLAAVPGVSVSVELV